MVNADTCTAATSLPMRQPRRQCFKLANSSRTSLPMCQPGHQKLLPRVDGAVGIEWSDVEWGTDKPAFTARRWLFSGHSLTDDRCGSVTDVCCGSVTDVRCGSVAAVRCELVTDVCCGSVTDVCCGSVTDVRCGSVTDVRCGSATVFDSRSGNNHDLLGSK